MAEFREVMNERDRMCRSIDCFDCIIGIKATTLRMGCREFIVDYPNESEHIIMEWAKGGQNG